MGWMKYSGDNAKFKYLNKVWNYKLDLLSSSCKGLGKSLRISKASSVVHFFFKDSCSWWATVVPGRDPIHKKYIKVKIFF